MVSLAVWWRMDGGRVGRVIESESPSVVSDSLWLHGLYTVHGIFYARMVEWAAFPFSRGSSQSRDQTQVSHIAGRFFTSWATREVEWVAYPSSSGSSQPNQTESKRGLLYCRWIFFFFLPTLSESPRESDKGVQFSSVQSLSCVRLIATPWTAAHQASLFHHQLPEFTQTHVHWIGDAIQPSHPLLSPSSPTFNLSQQQGLFQWVSSSHQVAKVLEFQLQHQSFQWIFRTDFL